MLNQITIHQLELFLAAAKLKNFSRAADHMSISQPAFSAQIIRLEKILKSPLFYRIGRKIRLTDAGIVFEDYAKKTLYMLREGKQTIDDMAKDSLGVLLIGASTSIGNYIVPQYLAKYNNLYPNSKVKVYIANSTQVEQSLLSNEIDIGIVEGPLSNGRLANYSFTDDELVVITHPEHRWCKAEQITIDELVEEPMIVREWGSGTRSIFMEMLGNRFEDLNILLEVGGTEAIKNSVMLGLGVSVVSLMTVEEAVKNKRLGFTRLKGYSLKRELSMILIKNRYIPNSVRYFIDILKPGTELQQKED